MWDYTTLDIFAGTTADTFSDTFAEGSTCVDCRATPGSE